MALSVSSAEKAANNAAKKYTYNENSTFAKEYKNALNSYNDLYNHAEKYGYNKYTDSWKDADGNRQIGVNELFEQVMNYGDFSYDMNKDKLFQMYKQQYNHNGKRAMENQMGIAAANSGGYNSSYAQTSSQDTYQQYMDQLSQKAVDTYQNAYSQWNNKFSQLQNRYNTLNTMNQQANEKYYTDLNNASDRLNTAYNAYYNDKTFDYNKYSDYRDYTANQLSQAQAQANWQADYNLQKYWNDKNYQLSKKAVNGG